MIEHASTEPARGDGPTVDSEAHRRFLAEDARRQLRFFERSLRPDGSIAVLDLDGEPLGDGPLELHTTTRLVHSYALGHSFGWPDAMRIVDAGMERLWRSHRDREHGGYLWSVHGDQPADGIKLAYGHVFTLLAAASAGAVGHPDAERLLDDVAEVIERRFWDEEHGLLRDEFHRDWTPFSRYRGMNANMHGAEAMLAAFETTGREVFLRRAERILGFFALRMAPGNGDRIPEHYTEGWQIDRDYAGNPMFRPAGTTPGHSFEFARLAIQLWDLRGRTDERWPLAARALVSRALADGWNRERGGFCYTLRFDGSVDVADRYWWPVTEAIGVLAALLRIDPTPEDEEWYAAIWRFAERHLVDRERGGWFPELDGENRPVARQFAGKPDIYHSLQATLLPLASGVSRLHEGLSARRDTRTL